MQALILKITSRVSSLQPPFPDFKQSQVSHTLPHTPPHTAPHPTPHSTLYPTPHSTPHRHSTPHHTTPHPIPHNALHPTARDTERDASWGSEHWDELQFQRGPLGTCSDRGPGRGTVVCRVRQNSRRIRGRWDTSSVYCTMYC